jgi:hypothetical protein
MTRRSDLPQLVDLLRTTADLLEQRGEHAWTLTREWQPGPGAANLDPGRGIGTIADPTGQAATAHQLDPHIQFINRLTTLRTACIDTRDSLDRVGPARQARWCWWFLQIGIHEPAPHAITGRPASAYVWNYRAKKQRLPTLDQLRARAGQRSETHA